jgi:hypothetical protein
MSNANDMRERERERERESMNIGNEEAVLQN